MNYYNEFEPKAAAALRQLIKDGLIPAGEVDTRSITDVTAADLKGFTQCHFFAGIGGWSRALELAGWPASRPVWTGSCPCQPFSSAGKQKGGTDDRDLWPVWFDLIRECRPASVYGEQVASAVSHGWLDRVFVNMEAEIYALAAAVLPACGVNAPHKRDRLWFVAHASNEGFQVGGCRQMAQSREVAEFERLRGGDVADTDQDGCSALPVSGLQDEKYHAQPCGSLDDTLDAGSQGHCGNEGAAERREGQARSIAETGFCGNAVGDTEGQRPGRRQNDQNEGRGQHAPADTSAGIWDDAEWIVCADGKARRIPSTQSGIRLLAHGIPERVGLLRAGGNAIVPEVAARFIKATGQV